MLFQVRNNCTVSVGCSGATTGPIGSECTDQCTVWYDIEADGRFIGVVNGILYRYRYTDNWHDHLIGNDLSF